MPGVVQPNQPIQRNSVMKTKKVKLKSLPAIKRRIFKLVSLICRERAGNICECCHQPKGYLLNGKPQRMECHHIFSRSIKNSPMKFDLNNLICLCTSCHKTGSVSAHKNPVVFAEFLRVNKPNQYQYILDHYLDTIDLEDRVVLEKIEADLLEEQKRLNSVVVV